MLEEKFTSSHIECEGGGRGWGRAEGGGLTATDTEWALKINLIPCLVYWSFFPFYETPFLFIFVF